MSRDTISGGRVTSPRRPNLLLLPLSSITFSLPLARRPRARVSRLYDGSSHRLCTVRFISLYSAFYRHIPNLTIAKSCSLSCSHIIVSPLCFFSFWTTTLYQNIRAAQGRIIVIHCFNGVLSLCQKKKKENHGSFAFFSLIVTKNLLYEQCGRRVGDILG
ncbi:hypothetical protein HDV57DRAFT_252536 [Trichoderma longibrachiatum]|uniref:Uncharacterized protein n=1 Tax=Trichoderma longibrachiatum ATCC 18648 TaxID=983965 RepID=A0A2T4C9F9_TRILO|nr:hypothetical protein M440DRAFT_256006 [Trichoderma longibrachiatum ATCC 18648]